MKKLNKKGFTLVELVIVIAVIAILAGVLIPTFSKVIQKANQSVDTQLIRNLNTAVAIELASEGKTKYDTAYEAVQACKKNGYDVKVIVAKSNYNVAYDLEGGHFVLLDESTDKVMFPVDASTKIEKTVVGNEKLNYFVFRNNNASTNGYSVYAGYKWAETNITLNGVGFDAGEFTGKMTISYINTTDSTKSVIIRTNGGTLNIGAAGSIAKGQIHQYGVTDKATVYTEMSCLHANGAIGSLDLEAGKAVAQQGSVVYLTKAAADVKVEQPAGKVFIPAEVKVGTEGVPANIAEDLGYSGMGTTYETAQRTNNSYEIHNLDELKQFRDLVNGGFSFKGCTVDLLADIRLDNGWEPIAVGSRKVSAEQYPTSYAGKNATSFLFKGTFDGKGHTISNLTNEGYVPRYDYKDGNDYAYCYGFFGVLSSEATVTNLKFANVNINGAYGTESASGRECFAESIGALVGFVDGNATLSNITVESGKIITSAVNPAAGGIIGRWYFANEEITLKNLVNKADISSSRSAGIIGFISNQNKFMKEDGTISSYASENSKAKWIFDGCENYGVITSNDHQGDNLVNIPNTSLREIKSNCVGNHELLHKNNNEASNGLD